MAVDRKGTKAVATNRQARRDYEVLETFECGIVLAGSEVKSLRDGRVQLTDSHARVRGGEVWLYGMQISPWATAGGTFGHVPDRERKLLLHRNEIDRLRVRTDQERLSLVPLAIYFRDGRAKVELAVGRGKRRYDKRQDLAKRDAALEAQRAMKASRQAGGDR